MLILQIVADNLLTSYLGSEKNGISYGNSVNIYVQIYPSAPDCELTKKMLSTTASDRGRVLEY
jgi:hypothetical protein